MPRTTKAQELTARLPEARHDPAFCRGAAGGESVYATFYRLVEDGRAVKSE